MQQRTNYVDYLQQLLKDNHIDFIGREDFEIREREKEKVFLKQDQGKQSFISKLKTNIDEPLNKELIQRYSRQMLLKEISYEGQVKIVKAKVALIGSGGIGCPLALYLAAAGIGTLGLFDSDSVDVTNLHRQIGHRTDRIGMEKT